MKYTLEQLKAMDATKLFEIWSAAEYPFDRALCDNCLTQHSCGMCSMHKGLIPKSFEDPFMLMENLEELYALRIFHDHLYPQPEQESTEEKAFARMEENEHDCRANTR